MNDNGYLCEGGRYCSHGSDSTHWVESTTKEAPTCSQCGKPAHGTYGCPELCCQNCGQAFEQCGCGR